MTTRLSFATIGPGARFIPVVLVAGVPIVLVPAGLHPTTLAVSTGSLDGAFWPAVGSLVQSLPGGATLDPVKGWLDTRHEWTISTEARLREGDCSQGALSFDLVDVTSATYPGGEVTAMLSGREAFAQDLLKSEVGSGLSDPIPLRYANGFPSSGWASIGRESVIYSSVSAGAELTIGVSPSRRGAFGSRATAHAYNAGNPPVVTASGVRSWHGRRLSLWVASLSADGLTITDPTLLFLGVVGKGIQLVGGQGRGSEMTRWRVPADSIVEALSAKVPARTVELYGINHHGGASGRVDDALSLAVQSDTPDYAATPLCVYWEQDYGMRSRVALVGADAAYHRAGWHADWPGFLQDFEARSREFYQEEYGTESEPAVRMLTDGRLEVRASRSGVDRSYLRVHWAWNTTSPTIDARETITAAVESAVPVPEAWIPLEGRVRVPRSEDFAVVPATLSSGTAPDLAWWGFHWAPESGQASSGTVMVPVTAIVTERDATSQTIVLHQRTSPGQVTVRAALRERAQLSLCVFVDASRWDLGLREACRLLDTLGGDWHEDSVDWTTIAAEVRRNATPGLPPARAYAITPGQDSLLDRIVQECRLAGLALCVRHGRLSVYRPGDVSASESTSSTVGVSHLIEPPVVQETTEGLASRVRFELPGGSSVVWVDETYRADYGDGEEVTVKVIDAPRPASRGDLLSSLRARAWAILGPVSQPWRELTLSLPVPFFDLSPGDLLSVTHPQVPTWSGTRGLTSAVCQVTSVSHRLWGGRARVVVRARLATGVPRGYAPAALIAAGGLNAASPVVTLDTTAAWGAGGFTFGADSDGGAPAFTAGDAVVLTEIDCSSVSTPDEAFTVASTSGATVTLSGNPSAAMAALAASQYKVALRTDYWSTATASQKTRFAYIADDSDGLLGTSDNPHRWSP